MRVLPHTRSCFVCGEFNPHGLNMRFGTDGRIVRATFTPQPEHIGFKGVVHGGILSTVLDEVMLWACAVQTKRFAFCAELNVRFIQPSRPGDETTVTAELIENRRGKIFHTAGELKNRAGELLAKASGKYLPINDAEAAGMAEDLLNCEQWTDLLRDAGQ
jgi:uncharacterized protein (TIGR00369 family)